MTNWYKLGYIILLSVLSCQVNAISWKGIVQRLVGAGRSYFYLVVHIPTESINRPNRITHILASSTDFSRPPIYPRFSLANLSLPPLDSNYFPPITRQQLEEMENVPSEDFQQPHEVIGFNLSRGSGETEYAKSYIYQGQYKTHNYPKINTVPDITLLNFMQSISIPGYIHFHDSNFLHGGNSEEGGMSIERYLRMPDENIKIAHPLDLRRYQLNGHLTTAHQVEPVLLRDQLDFSHYTLHAFLDSEGSLIDTRQVPYYFTLSESGKVRMLRSEEVPQMNIMVINDVHIPIWDKGFGYSIALVPISLASKFKFITPDIADEYNSVMKESGNKRDDGASGGGAATVASLFDFTHQVSFPFTKREMKHPGKIFSDTLKGADNSNVKLKTIMSILFTLWLQQKSI